jgi:hypothetical protein
MLGINKRIAKMKNYWLYDSNFRRIVYAIMREQGGRGAYFLRSRAEVHEIEPLALYSDLIQDLEASEMEIYYFLDAFLFQNRQFNSRSTLSKDAQFWFLGHNLGMERLVQRLIKLFLQSAENKDWFVFKQKAISEFEKRDIDFLNEVAAFHLGTLNYSSDFFWSERQKNLHSYGQDLVNSDVREKFKSIYNIKC